MKPEFGFHICDSCEINDICLNAYEAESEILVGCKDYMPITWEMTWEAVNE